ncbi:ATP synthase F1 subunit epsilon [Mycoplasma sp. Mirounga ES2805-ORL]|uniref:ATP synthase F1 subunit epsilon n=1 Tax=Mycoplasma sp. Mirounga ES2805-ORL TaxID=754514 RepID=UPI00197C7EDB|nr:ATP synthase F1 subunit epsilon [Mycoplasma sp. Mirounga ES2805-ORL]QSF13837.1 ATP synthase F1 subunit epsilon [Mycoplasma sp. Mirounga ES2805-ORL]
MEAKTTHLTIMTSSNLFLDEDVSQVYLKTKYGGAITILPNRTPIFSIIDVCKMEINRKGEKGYKACYIGNGFVYANSKEVQIITNDIIFDQNIDIEKAKRDKEIALQNIEKYKNTKKEIIFEQKLRKAINKINIYNNK